MHTLRKHILISSAMLCLIALSSAQTPGEWTWMHGNSTPNPTGVFGVKGIAHPNNKPPGLYEPCEWKDKNGNFWLFGGMATTGIYAALWKYDVSANQWTWMSGPSFINQPGIYGTQGAAAPNNYPSARGYGTASWTDTSGNLWLFGGTRYTNIGNDLLNDLWKYDINTNQWTWIKGSNTINDPGNYGIQGVTNSSNVPPARWETSCSWTDNNGDLWLFGGGSSSGDWLNDLWKYNIANNQWTWIHGSNNVNAAPVYGTQGVAASSNTPGARYVYCSWADNSGDLWLFSGEDTALKKYNDLWKYNIASNQWTWMKGPNTTNSPGNYGARCQSSAGNLPPARFENRARMLDACNNFWNFGGDSGFGFLNDLWHLDPGTGQWTWISGDTIAGQPPVYGTLAVSSPTTKPGSRRGNVGWIDNNGNIWIFGGEGPAGRFNDLFRYVPDPTCVPVAQTMITVSPNTTVCIGQIVTLNASGSINYVWSPGGQTTTSITVSLTSSVTYTVTGSSSCSANNNTVTVTVIPPPSAAISGNDTICAGDNAILNATGGNNYLWSTGESTASITVSPASSTIYTATVSIGNCVATTNYTLTVNPNPAVNAFSNVTILAGTNTTLNSGSTLQPASYYWSPATGLSCTSCQNPVAAPIITTKYCIIITDSNYCTDSACVTVTIEDSCSRAGDLYLPNAFSPNDDGDNDVLRVYYGNINCIAEIRISIFNKWGQLIYESTDPKAGWDGSFQGEKLNAAVFSYQFKAILLSGEEILRKGNISLLR